MLSYGQLRNHNRHPKMAILLESGLNLWEFPKFHLTILA